MYKTKLETSEEDVDKTTLETSEEVLAIEHTPTLIELYLMKAKIHKRIAKTTLKTSEDYTENMKLYLENAEKARNMDYADR